jgi:hypothetical protein
MLNSSVPRWVVPAVGGVILAIGFVAGLVSDLHLGRVWLLPTIVAGVLIAIIVALAGQGEWTVAAVACVALIVIGAGVAVLALDARHELDDTKMKLANAERAAHGGGARTFSFIVFHGEEPPDSTSGFSTPTSAFERAEPDISAGPAPGADHDLNSHVRVVCALSTADDAFEGPGNWYRVVSGNWMASDVIKPAPYTGEDKPPKCPGVEPPVPGGG